jgi:hypothetical protein
MVQTLRGMWLHLNTSLRGNPKMLISTIVLNWNRQTLLEQTLRSYKVGTTTLNHLASAVTACIVDNDQLERSQHVRDCFAAFTGLGQLSLHGAVPTDDEAWEVKPAHLRFSKGKIVYEAEANVGTSSVIPAQVFRAGVRLYNIPQDGAGTFKFPDDGRLSTDIKKLGLWCAWSDRYYVAQPWP